MIKRTLDFVSSLVGIILLTPLFIILGVLIKIDSQGGVFYLQERIGRDGIPFKIFKFRTMYSKNNSEGKLTIGNDKKITRAGYTLRKYKLDELPQLFNVIRGDMSLVGPRPEVKDFLDSYEKEELRKILSVRPGITDQASLEMINENEILGTYDDPEKAYIEKILPIKKKHHLNYISNRNLYGDIAIILTTIKTIILKSS